MAKQENLRQPSQPVTEEQLAKRLAQFGILSELSGILGAVSKVTAVQDKENVELAAILVCPANASIDTNE